MVGQESKKIELFYNHCSVQMKDDSVYVENNPYWLGAIRMRLKENEHWLEHFVEIVNEHWKKRTIPTKFDWDESWKKEYKNQAELAGAVLYPYIRVILMGFAFEEGSSGKGKVLALNQDGSVTEYPSGKKHKNFKCAVRKRIKKKE